MRQCGQPGAWIIHYTYDALGRLIRAQRPVPAAAGGLPGDVYTEHYYLDGVRRVQEVHNNPVFPTGGGGSEEQSMGEETGGSVANRTWVDREYVYTTGYVDEIVCETDEFDYPWYHLQDANYNVVGIVHESGAVKRRTLHHPAGPRSGRDTTSSPGCRPPRDLPRLWPNPAPDRPSGHVLRLSRPVEPRPRPPRRPPRTLAERPQNATTPPRSLGGVPMIRLGEPVGRPLPQPTVK